MKTKDTSLHYTLTAEQPLLCTFYVLNICKHLFTRQRDMVGWMTIYVCVGKDAIQLQV